MTRTYATSGGVSTGGTVTSVAMTGDNVIYNATVTGSPITTSGTLVPVLKTQTANTVLAGPTTGAAATPTFRALVAGDIPSLSGLYALLDGTNQPFTGNVTVTMADPTYKAFIIKNTSAGATALGRLTSAGSPGGQIAYSTNGVYSGSGTAYTHDDAALPYWEFTLDPRSGQDKFRIGRAPAGASTNLTNFLTIDNTAILTGINDIVSASGALGNAGSSFVVNNTGTTNTGKTRISNVASGQANFTLNGIYSGSGSTYTTDNASYPFWAIDFDNRAGTDYLRITRGPAGVSTTPVTLLKVQSTGEVDIGGAGASISATLGVTALSASTKVLILKGAASQSANLFEIQNSAGGILINFTPLGGAVFNEQGNDTDFRVEGDTDANLLFLDASTDRIGIGVSAPATKLDITHNFAGLMRLTNTGAQSPTAGTSMNFTTDPGAAMSINNRMGYITFNGAYDAIGSRITGASIESFAGANWSGSNNAARLVFSTIGPSSTTIAERMRISDRVLITSQSAAIIPLTVKGAASQSGNLLEVQNSAGSAVANVTALGGAVFNEQGNDADFRIEGDTDANLFFVDASVDEIGIGTSTPAAKLHVLSTTEQLRLGYDASNYKSETISSTGSVTTALTGTSPINIFSQAIRGNGGYQSSDGSAGATGSFTTVDLKTVTVKDGIITSIV